MYEWLALDHVNDDGHADPHNGVRLLNRLIKENYPPYMQVLCHNCNTAKRTVGADRAKELGEEARRL